MFSDTTLVKYISDSFHRTRKTVQTRIRLLYIVGVGQRTATFAWLHDFDTSLDIA